MSKTDLCMNSWVHGKGKIFDVQSLGDLSNVLRNGMSPTKVISTIPESNKTLERVIEVVGALIHRIVIPIMIFVCTVVSSSDSSRKFFVWHVFIGKIVKKIFVFLKPVASIGEDFW